MLFNTKQWTRDLEKGYREAWERWVLGVDVEDSAETEALEGEEVGVKGLWKRVRESGHIWVKDL